jgi:hypothetical protein
VTACGDGPGAWRWREVRARHSGGCAGSAEGRRPAMVSLVQGGDTARAGALPLAARHDGGVAPRL